MIGTFWNLCRACPSIPLEKSRPEYRSNFQWYEYTGPQKEIVKPAPKESPSNSYKIEEREAQPVKFMANSQVTLKNTTDGVRAEVNIKKNPIFYKNDTDYPTTATINKGIVDLRGGAEKAAIRYRSRVNRKDSQQPSRRSKSEGPAKSGKSRRLAAANGFHSPSPPRTSDAAARKPNGISVVDFRANNGAECLLIKNYEENFDVDSIKEEHLGGSGGNTEYRLQYAWPKPNAEITGAGVTSGSNSGQASASVSPNALEVQDFNKAAGAANRKISVMREKAPVPVHKKRRDKRDDCETVADQTDRVMGVKEPEKGVEYNSEYKKNFRPFSQYDYVAGRFTDKNDNGRLPISATGVSWFEEVIELRKKAGEYKHRGWGTELVPQHLAELYNKQLALWEHVSRRSSLSALTLATTMQKPKYLTKEEKGKENARKLPGKARFISVDRCSSAAKKIVEKNEETKKGFTKMKDDKSPSQIKDGRSRSAGPIRSVYKKVAVKGDVADLPVESVKRPYTLQTNARASRYNRNTSTPCNMGKSLKSPPILQKNGVLVAKKIRDKNTILNYLHDKIPAEEPLMKSTPEPTRVKSPEQCLIIKSPEAVRWTVPLDTGRVFTVTQTIEEEPHRSFQKEKFTNLRQDMIQTSGSKARMAEAKAAAEGRMKVKEEKYDETDDSKIITWAESNVMPACAKVALDQTEDKVLEVEVESKMKENGSKITNGGEISAN